MKQPQNDAATKQDIKTFDKKIDTVEKNLDKKIDTLDKKIDTVYITLDHKIDTVRDELKEDARKNKDEIMNTLVAIVGELQTIREEQIVSVDQYRNHEERIVHLEKLQGVHS